MTAQQAKDILLPIPEEDFIMGDYTDDEKCCARGYLDKHFTGDPCGYSKEVSDLNIDIRMTLETSIENVNDNKPNNPYEEATPKQRVMHLLNDAIAAGL